MAIQNINSINYPGEFNNLNSQTEEYLIQALANLGQRYSIKGDGIGIRTIRFADIIDAQNYSSSEYIGYVGYCDNNDISQIMITVCPINDLSHPLDVQAFPGAITESNVNHVISNLGSSNSNIGEFTVAVNETGVTKCSNTYIYSDEHYVVFSLIEHTGEGNADAPRYTCQKYNKYTNELISGLRILKTAENVDSLIYVQKT